jgi:hypothetical protein
MINGVDGEVDIPKPRELSEYNVPERAGNLAIPAWSAFSAVYMQSLRKLADDYPRFMNSGVVVTAAPSSSTSPTRPPRTSRGTTKVSSPCDQAAEASYANATLNNTSESLLDSLPSKSSCKMKVSFLLSPE